MKYNVKYKMKGQIFFSKIKNVVGDSVINQPDMDVVRVFTLEDETLIEVPMRDTVFIFSKERYLVIKKNMEKEGAKI